MVKEYGYEYEAALDEELWSMTQGLSAEDEQLFGALCLRSGRDALMAVAAEYEPRTVLLPALACDSMVLPFEKVGHSVRFYRLYRDYSAVTEDIAAVTEPALLLYMNYFGLPAIADETLETLRSRGNFVFIEDRTHDLFCEKSSSFRPDYTIASLRKWLPVPDGGLLWGNVSVRIKSDTAFSARRLRAQNMRYEFLHGGEASLKPEYRQIFSTVSDIIDGEKQPAYMSAYSFALAQRTDWAALRETRRENAEALISVLSASPHVTFIQGRPGMSDLYVPFTVPHRDKIQTILSAEGIFNTIIWPLTPEQKRICPVAKFTEENMLAAPCDQRYTPADMLTIGKEIVRVIEDVNR